MNKRVPIKHLFDVSRDMIIPTDYGDEPIFHYSLPAWHELGDGVTENASDLASGKLLLKGDEILVSKLNPEKNAVLLAEKHEIPTVCSPEFIALVPKRIDRAFAYYFMLSAPLRHQLNASVESVTNSHKRARVDRFLASSVDLPDLATQCQIAEFLDRETARIDLLIEKKQRLVALLGEKHFADLESVTFPADTPADELLPFRWICRIAEGQVDPTSETWRTKTLIAPNHIESKTGRLLSMESAENQGAISGKYAFGAGTVLYSKIRPALAKACIAPSTGMCSADMYPIIPDKRLRPEYLLMQFLSARFTDWATLESMRVAMPKINRETLGGFRLRVPPIETQEQYIQYFAKNRVRFEAVTDKINASIDNLKEYRATLITAAVTGHIDLSTYAKSGTPDRRLDTIEEEMDA